MARKSSGLNREWYLTWGGHMKACKMLQTLEIPFTAKKKWFGYVVILGNGIAESKIADNWWKQFWCWHIWDRTGTHRMQSFVMNQCKKCNHVAAGGPP